MLTTSPYYFLYFQQVQIIAQEFADANSRTVIFGRVDLVVNLLTILLLLFVTGPLINRFGAGLILALVPALLAVPLAQLWVGVSIWLGRQHDRIS